MACLGLESLGWEGEMGEKPFDSSCVRWLVMKLFSIQIRLKKEIFTPGPGFLGMWSPYGDVTKGKGLFQDTT